MITDSYDIKTQPLMSLRDFYGEPQQILDVCLVTFSYEIFHAVLQKYDCEEIARIRAANGFCPIYRFSYDGLALGIYLSPIGSTSASQYVIESNWLTGARHFVMFGSAGSLDREVTANKYVIPTESYRDEGMSYHYAPPADYIKVQNHVRVAQLFAAWGVPYVTGRIWTTDAFFRETVGQIARRKNEGCIAVEMEVAGVQAVCDFHGFALYNFLVTGDVLSTTEYDRGTLSEANHNLDKLYLALRLAKTIATQSQ